MNITDIYLRYNLMPQLQLHQLRVAGVAEIICEHVKIPLDTHSIISTCLLHDMGNIIKFQLKRFPEFLEPEGLDYWQGIKDEYIRKYGNDEHIATHAIAKEIGVNQPVSELIHAVGFSKAKINYESENFGIKIAAYSDLRVDPYKVTSMDARLEDARERYKVRVQPQDDQAFFEEMVSYLAKIEEQIFAKTDITPEFITNELVNTKIEQLKNFEL